MQLITLNTKNTSYQMGVNEKGFLFHLYYGPRMDCDASQLLTYYFRGANGVPYDYKGGNTFSCDFLPQEYSCCGGGDYRRHAFVVTGADGSSAVDLRYSGHSITEGKYSIPGLPAAYGGGAQTCAIVLEDKRIGVRVTLRYGVFYDEDVICRAVEVENTGTNALHLNRVMSMSMDFLSGEYEIGRAHV